jgi:hypothetical protein
MTGRKKFYKKTGLPWKVGSRVFAYAVCAFLKIKKVCISSFTIIGIKYFNTILGWFSFILYVHESGYEVTFFINC